MPNDTELAQAIFGERREDAVPLPQSTSTVYATATADSSGGTVNVVMDGESVVQAESETTTADITIDQFDNGEAELPSAAYPGTLTITDDDGNELPADAYQVDGATLTIYELQGVEPVDVAYTTNIALAVLSTDFISTDDGDTYELPQEPLATVEMVEITDQGTTPITVTVDGTTVTAQNVATVEDASFVISYERDVTLTPELVDGFTTLPDAPDSITVEGITYNGDAAPTVETLSEDEYVLDGDTLSITAVYDAYQVFYTMPVEIALNYSDTLPDSTLEDTEEETEEAEETAAENAGLVELPYQPNGAVSVTCDGEAYEAATIEDGTLALNWAAQAVRTYQLSYEIAVSLDYQSAAFANGAIELPSVPSGEVTATVDGEAVEVSLDGYMLTIPSLVREMATYHVSYQAAIETGIVELPTAPSVREGEAVQVSVVNGTPIVTSVIGEGDRQDANIQLAYEAAAEADELAQEVQAIASATNQHFWHRATDAGDGAGAGAFVTDIEQDAFITAAQGGFADWQPDESQPNYKPYFNLLENSQGIILRSALRWISAFSHSAVTFFDGLGNAAANIVARFGANGAQIGKDSESHLVLDYHSMQGIDKNGNVYFDVSDLRGEDGYAEFTESKTDITYSSNSIHTMMGVRSAATTSVTINGLAASVIRVSGQNVYISPSVHVGDDYTVTYQTNDKRMKAYTLGGRLSGSIIGPSSLAEGSNTTASGFYAHAEGGDSKAIGLASHAEGSNTRASGFYAHAEGDTNVAEGDSSHAEGAGSTLASGLASHAEGIATEAIGRASHAQNSYTVAASDSQTALGKYNVEDANDAYAVIVGNGISVANRSNALTVEWSGNVECGNVNGVDLPNGVLLLKGASAISANTDLDTITDTGTYYANSTTAATLTNCPVSGAFKLYVERTLSTATYLKQRFELYNGVNEWVRFTTNGGSSWSVWYREAPHSSDSATANQFLATPNGSAGIPNYRAIVNADLPVINAAHGGTGETTLGDSMNALIGALGTATATPTDDMMVISETSTGGTGKYFKRKISTIWPWVRGKMAPATHDVKSLITQTSTQSGNFTISAATLVVSGFTAQLTLDFTISAALTANTEYSLGTLPASIRPAARANAGVGDSRFFAAIANGVMYLRPQVATTASATVTYRYNSTYILASDTYAS